MAKEFRVLFGTEQKVLAAEQTIRESSAQDSDITVRARVKGVGNDESISVISEYLPTAVQDELSWNSFGEELYLVVLEIIES